jgi:hypothetical protein
MPPSRARPLSKERPVRVPQLADVFGPLSDRFGCKSAAQSGASCTVAWVALIETASSGSHWASADVLIAKAYAGA